MQFIPFIAGFLGLFGAVSLILFGLLFGPPLLIGWHAERRLRPQQLSAAPPRHDRPQNEILQIPDNTLKIAKLSLEAPIFWETDYRDILERLPHGLVHLVGTAKPGERGNIVIGGHSSGLWFLPGPFNRIFARLGELEPGDTLLLTYKGRAFRYQVSESFEVKPTELRILEPTPRPTLTLFTCSPVGTALRRRVIRAELLREARAARNPSDVFLETQAKILAPD